MPGSGLKPSRLSGRPSRMSGNVRKPLLDVWGPLGYPGVARRLSRISGSGREALSNVQEWSGDPPGCP